MTTGEKFIMKSDIERQALSSIIPLLFKDKDISFYFTPSEGFDIYDAYVMEFDKDTKSIIGRWIIEVKVRDRFYPELMLEKKKYEDLKNKSNECYSNMIYISVTPMGAYCFNLNKIINDDTQWIKEDHWISTTDKSLGKTKKSIIYLPVDNAKKIQYDSSTAYIQYSNTKLKQQLNNTMDSHKKTFCLFKDIFNKE